MVKGTSLAPDAVVLTPEEASELSDRVYQVRCAAEDVATAIDEGAGGGNTADSPAGNARTSSARWSRAPHWRRIPWS